MTPDKRTRKERFRLWASRLVGHKPAELEQWAHDGKIAIVARALEQAYNEGREEALGASDG